MKGWTASGWLAAVTMTCVLAGAQPAAAAYPGVAAATKTVNGHEVQLVYADLNDRNLEVKAVSAEDKVGATQTLGSLADDQGALAALNGGYFNAYSDKQPLTVVRSSGEFAHNGSFGAVFGMDLLNKAYFGRVYPTIEGGTKGSWSWPNNWAAWGINHYYDNADAITILTPAVRKQDLSGGKTVVVRNGVVQSIVDGDAQIPSDGYLVHYGPNVASSASVFKVGEKAAYKITYRDENGKAVKWEQVANMMGGGPLLVANGNVVVDPEAEHFTDPKQTSRSARSVRSFVGVNDSNRLVMGTVDNVSVYELADVVQELGLVGAVGMDSGATAGLYADGDYLTRPGREVPNAIVVRLRSSAPSTRSGFADVVDSHWAVDPIKRLREKSVMIGSEERGMKFFHPEDELTRAELATLVVRAFGLPQGASGTFGDASGKWYESYVNAAAAAGVMNGYTTTQFGGGDAVTEEQVAAIFARMLAKNGVKESYSDMWLSKDPSDWAKTDVHTAIKQGLLNDSFGAAAFDPHEKAERAGVAVMLDVALQKLGR
jgi:exopolysaccharide biosynthesis protein